MSDRRGMIGIVDSLFFLMTVSVVCCLMIGYGDIEEREELPVEAWHRALLEHEFVSNEGMICTVDLVSLRFAGEEVPELEDEVSELISFLVRGHNYSWTASWNGVSIFCGELMDGDVHCHQARLGMPYGGGEMVFELRIALTSSA